MTMSNDEQVIEEAKTEEELPFAIGPVATGASSNNLDIEKMQQQETIRANDHSRRMQWAEFNSIFKLLGWCIFLSFAVYMLSFWKSTPISSTFFDLLKTIIVAVVGFLLGQKPKNGG